jgi:acyl carrier protein
MSPESIIARVFGVARSSVTEATSNKTLSTWDSLNHVTLILELEAAYGISVSAEEALTMTDVGAIKRVLLAHGADLDGA